MRTFEAKLGDMRKAVEWTVYPRKDGDPKIIIQSNTRIAMFDVTTGIGVLSANKPNGASFIHLSRSIGATPIQVPNNVIMSALDAMPKSGDEIGPGVRIA